MRATALLPWLLLGSGCTSAAPATTAGSSDCPTDDALVIASDYSSSGVGGFDVVAAGGAAPGLTVAVDLGKDPALATSAGRAFYVARDKDVVFELDARCGKPVAKTLVHDASSARTSNPQDVAVAADGSLWVPYFNVPAIGVFSAAGAPSRVDLSAFDGDGNPNASAVAIVADKAYVALERLDDADQLKPKQTSQIARVDVATHAVEARLDLVARDPFGKLVPFGGGLWLAAPGSFDATDEEAAGIERFDPASFTSKLVVKEKDLGGSVVEVAVTDGCGAAIVANAVVNVNATSLVTFDPTTGAVLASAAAPVLSTSGFDLAGLAWAKGALLVGDRRATGGGFAVHVLDASGCTLHERAGGGVVLAQKPVALHARGAP